MSLGGRRCVFQAEQTFDALPLHIRRQVADVVLERVGHPGIGNADHSLALVLQVVLAQEVVQQAVEVVVMGKDHVAANIPGEALVVAETGREAAGMGVFFQDQVVRDAEFTQALGRAQAGGAGAEDQMGNMVGGHTFTSILAGRRVRSWCGPWPAGLAW